MRASVRILAFVGALVGFSLQIAQAQTQVVTPVPYVTGGIGLGEREALSQEAKLEGYNLKVVTAATDGAYLANVSVRVSDREGGQVFEGAMDGPWLFAKLPAGQYTVTASDGAQTQKRTVQISEKGMREVMFLWQRAGKAQGTEPEPRTSKP